MTTFLRPGTYVDTSLIPLNQSALGIPGEAIAAFAAAFNQGPVKPVQISSFGQFTSLFGSFATANGSLLHHAVYQFFNNRGSGCLVCRVANQDAVSATLAINDVNSPPDSVMTVTASSPGTWGNNVYVEVVSAGITGRFTLNVYVGGSAQANFAERFPSVSVNPADPRNVMSVVNSPVSGSKNISVTVTLPGSAYVSGIDDPALQSPTPLAGGADGSVAPTLGTAVPAAYDQIQNQILNLNLPGVSDITSINDLLAWADVRGDVEIIIDGPQATPGETSSQIASDYISLVQGSSIFQADANGQLYAPWVLVADPSSSIAGATRLVPPGGLVLAIWDKAAHVYGVQQSPAGTWSALTANDLETRFTNSDEAALNGANVNALMVIPGIGPCVFGARTLTTALPSMYIAIQRTLIQLTHDMQFLTLFSVFAPNNANLWAQIESVLENYLTQQMQTGVLQGSTAADSFIVTCDDTNNTPTTVSSGIVNIDAGVALTGPAEFVVINLQQIVQGGSTASTTTS